MAVPVLEEGGGGGGGGVQGGTVTNFCVCSSAFLLEGRGIFNYR